MKVCARLVLRIPAALQQSIAHDDFSKKPRAPAAWLLTTESSPSPGSKPAAKALTALCHRQVRSQPSMRTAPRPTHHTHLRHMEPLPSLPQGKLVPTTGPLPWFLSKTLSGRLLSNPSGCCPTKKPPLPQLPSHAPPARQHSCRPDLEQRPAGAGLRLAEGTGPSPAYGHQGTNTENTFTLQLW